MPSWRRICWTLAPWRVFGARYTSVGIFRTPAAWRPFNKYKMTTQLINSVH
jgi:hypothetical protein